MNPFEHMQVQGLADASELDQADARDLEVLTRVAALVTGAPRAFVSFAGDAQMLRRGGGQASVSTPREESFCACALLEDEMLVATDVRQDERTRAVAERRKDMQVVTYAGALIKADDGRKLGTLCVMDERARVLDDEQLQLLRGLARQVMNLVSLRHAKSELTEALRRMTVLATTDDLTGLLNRRAFFEQAEDLSKLVSRNGGQMCVAVVDLDHFKRINDTHGHAAGDEVLRRVAAALRNALRSTDKIGRIGGEELAIALPFTSLEAASEVVEGLRQTVEALHIEHAATTVGVTCSAGVARVGGATVERALVEADRALYAAKAAGRNRVQFA